MWELDYKESWAPKNWCFWTVVLEKTLESLLKCKEIKPVNPKGNQSWMFIGRIDGEAETPILWPPDAKNWLIWKDPDAGKDWRQEEKGRLEDEMIGWHHRLDGHEFEQALGSWWWTGKPGVLQSMGSQRVGHNWATELNWIELLPNSSIQILFSCFAQIFHLTVYFSFEHFYFALVNNAVMVSGEQWRDSAILVHVSHFPQTLSCPDCHMTWTRDSILLIIVQMPMETHYQIRHCQRNH